VADCRQDLQPGRALTASALGGRIIASFLLFLATTAVAQDPPPDPWLAHPVDDAAFQGYLQLVNTDSDAYFLPAMQVRPWMALAKAPRTVRGVEGSHGCFSDDDRAFVMEWLRGVPFPSP
jgi:hypothetical protein